MAILNSNQISVYVHGLDHAEGIAWGMDGYIYAGSEAGQVYRIDPSKPEAKVLLIQEDFCLVWLLIVLTTSTPVTQGMRLSRR